MTEITQGHNSASFGQELREDIETILSDDHEKLFHFAKWHIEDYILGTTGMKLEIEGAYMRFLMRLYQRGKPLPDDDRFMAVLMGLSVRVWKRVKDSLITIGKIVRKAGCLTNSRFEKERKARAEQLRKQSEGMRQRWKKQKEIEKVSQEFGETFDEVSPKLSQNISKKTNEINGVSDSQLHILKKEEKEKEENNNPLSIETARAGGRGAIADPFGLNPHMQDLRKDVWVDSDDRLQVGNGFKIELENLAGGPEQLRIELDMAAEWVGLNNPPQTLKAKVRGRVQKQVSERKDRDRRYEKAKQQNELSSKSFSDKLLDGKPLGFVPRPREEHEA